LRVKDQSSSDAPLDSSRSTAARLDSWKQIAVHFGRDVRTVRRWEGERNLPVHRLPGRERSGVFAYIDELEEWRHSSHGSHETFDLIDAVLSPDLNLPEEAQPPIDAPVVASDIELTPPPATLEHETPPSRRKLAPAMLALSLVAALLLTAVALVAVTEHKRHRAALAAAREHPTSEALDLYLQGRYFWNRRTEPDLTRSVDLFTQSIVHDPKYAAPYSGLADSYILLREYGHMQDSEAFPRALAAAREAVVLDDSSPDAHRSLAFILNYWTWDFAAAEREFQRAIELNPKDPQTRHWYASALASQARTDDAIKQIDIARSLDPLSVSILSDRALFISGRQPQQAAAIWHSIEQSDPGFSSVHRYMSDQDLFFHRYPAFFAERHKFADLTGDKDLARILNDSEQAFKGHGSAAMYKTLAAGFGEMADKGSQSAYNAAVYYVFADNLAEANHYLDLSFQRHESSFLSITSNGMLAPLHGTPEFRDLVVRLNAAVAAAAAADAN
jgi:tetratricopeptide (TPR) repeat protein